MSAEPLTQTSQPVSPAKPSPSFLTLGLWVLVGLGLSTFLLGVAGGSAQRAWQAYLVNWLFWSGLALSGLTFSAILQVTKAEWAGPLRPLAEALAAFLPISFVLLLFLFLGSDYLFSWLQHPIPAKQAWLNKPFLILRSVFAGALLYGCGFALLRASLQASGSLAARYAAGGLPRIFLLFVSQEQAADTAGGKRRLTLLSPLFILLYAVVFSLVAFDLVMSLEPHWISTVFGAYFCIGNMYAGLSLLAILAVLTCAERFSAERRHDLGKLLFGFCVLWTYLFWCQYLPIWYGNLPEETSFLAVRLFDGPWSAVSLVVLLLNFLLPFPLLLLQWTKRTPATLAGISALILVGVWLERYILVVPSIWRDPWLPLGWIECGLLLGFFALFTLAFRAWVQIFPLHEQGLETREPAGTT